MDPAHARTQRSNGILMGTAGDSSQARIIHDVGEDAKQSGGTGLLPIEPSTPCPKISMKPSGETYGSTRQVGEPRDQYGGTDRGLLQARQAKRLAIERLMELMKH